MTKRHISQVRDKHWYDQYRSGKPQSQIAKDCNKSQSYVSQRIKKHKDKLGVTRTNERIETAMAMEHVEAVETEFAKERIEMIDWESLKSKERVRAALAFAMTHLHPAFQMNIGKHEDFIDCVMRKGIARYNELAHPLGGGI